MLDHPGGVVAEPVGKLDLIEGILEELQLAVRFPGAGQLQLVENAELHERSLPGRRHNSAAACGAPALLVWTKTLAEKWRTANRAPGRP